MKIINILRKCIHVTNSEGFACVRVSHQISMAISLEI